MKPKAVLSKLNGPAKSSEKHTADKTKKSVQSGEFKDAPKGSIPRSDDAEDTPKTQEGK